MLAENEFRSDTFRDVRLSSKQIASGQSALYYGEVPLAQTAVNEINFHQARVTERASMIDRRISSNRVSEHGLLRSFSAHIDFIQRLVDGSLIAVIYCTTLYLHGVVLSADHFLAATAAVLFFLIFAEMNGVYKSWRTSPQSHEVRVLFTVWAMVIVSLLMLAFATKTSAIFSRMAVVIWFVAVPFILSTLRLARRNLLSYELHHGMNTRSVAIVGNTSIGHRLIKHFDATPWAGLVVKGFFDARRTEKSSVEVGGKTYSINTLDVLLQKARSGEIDSVYIALPLSSERMIEEVVNQLSDTTASVYVVPDSLVSVLQRARWVDFGGMPLLSIQETPFYGVHSWLKRLEDIVLSSLILLLISPLMLGIAVAVKATSPGPVFFKQRRYGLNGSVVEVWKFRSMSVCENGANVLQATKNDSRVTPLGAFLRKTSLDELPQFINVLQGYMSVVGPRPHAVSHNEQYRQLIKGYMIRHKVKPGISGWAQINGWRGETDTLDKMRKRVEFDMEYIQNWSLMFDLKIVFLTVFRGFVGKNAY